MSTFKLPIRKEKDVLSSENTHTCSKACWFCPSSPSVTGELPCAQRAPGCRHMHTLAVCPPLKGLPPIFKKHLFQAHTGILVRRDSSTMETCHFRAKRLLQLLFYHSFQCIETFFVSLFFLKRSNFTFILAQLGISDNQFPLKSCRDGKWGLPSLEMNFYLPDYFFYNELVNDPQS